MKPPRTDAEWNELMDIEEAALDATQNEAEYRAVVREFEQLYAELDTGPSRDAFEVLDEIQAEIDARHPRTKITYEPEHRSMYLKLRSGDAVESTEVAPGIVLDLDADGTVVGIDVDDVDRPVDVSVGPPRSV
jgi:uncharacterized protein YuzE